MEFHYWEKRVKTCCRIRMTARGELKPCLCYEDCVSVRDLLRSEEGDEAELVSLEMVGTGLTGEARRIFERHYFETEER